MKPSPTLRRVLASDMCSGCGGCAGLVPDAIAMGVSSDGYLRPQQSVTISAEEEEAIAASCPGALAAPWPDAAERHPIWGTSLRRATGNATDEALRHHASSGGMISALLIDALERGEIDAVVQVAPDPGRADQNVTIVSTTAEEITARAGSRYAPSSPLEHFCALVADGRRFAIVGKPCDIGAARQLIERDAEAKRAFPLLVSFFCGGVPSRRAADALLRGMGVEDARELASFRYRGDGWPGQAVAVRPDGSRAAMGYNESWGGYLSKGVQLRCKVCPDAVGGAADVVAADAWFGDEKGYPSFEEGAGRSAVIARTPVGEARLRTAEAGGRIALTPLEWRDLDRMQPSQARRKRQALSRHWALRLAGRTPPRTHGVGMLASARMEPLANQARSFAGMLYRLWQGRS